MVQMATNEELLAGVPLFAGLAPRSLRAFADACVRVRATKGEVLFREGDPSGGIYIIVSGRLRIERMTSSGEKQVIGVRTAGDFVGEMSLLDGQPRSADIVCAAACRLLMLRREDFEQLILNEPSASLEIMKSLSLRIREADSRLLDLRSKEVWQRLLDQFRRDADATGQVIAESQSRLAEQLGCTREAVNRALTRLEREGRLDRLGSRTYRLR